MTTNIDQALQTAFEDEAAPTEMDLIASLSKQLGGVIECLGQLDQRVSHNALIIGEVEVASKERYKFLNGEMQYADGQLEQRLEKLEAKMTGTRNAVGYCLRKVREAVDTDPQNAYLAKILDAIDDLASKID